MKKLIICCLLVLLLTTSASGDLRDLRLGDSFEEVEEMVKFNVGFSGMFRNYADGWGAGVRYKGHNYRYRLRFKNNKLDTIIIKGDRYREVDYRPEVYERFLWLKDNYEAEHGDPTHSFIPRPPSLFQHLKERYFNPYHILTWEKEMIEAGSLPLAIKNRLDNSDQNGVLWVYGWELGNKITTVGIGKRRTMYFVAIKKEVI